MAIILNNSKGVKHLRYAVVKPNGEPMERHYAAPPGRHEVDDELAKAIKSHSANELFQSGPAPSIMIHIPPKDGAKASKPATEAKAKAEAEAKAEAPKPKAGRGRNRGGSSS